jgi:predicted TIM-barrel fold metal-dependent hydrolase
MKSSSRLVIDCDLHNGSQVDDLLPHLPAYWKNLIKQQGIPQPAVPYYSPVGVIRADIDHHDGVRGDSDPAYVMEHHMKANNITYGILTGNHYGVSILPDVPMGNALASAANDSLAERWLSFSDRYRGSIVVNHSDPQAAVQEIYRMAADKRFVQIIMCSAARILFGQRHYHPIYEAAERHGLPVAFHTGYEGRGNSLAPTPSGYPSLYFEWHNIIPINYMSHINSLVCEGVFEKFPGLKIVGLEGGVTWLTHLLWRMDKNYKALRSVTPWLKRLPSEYIIDHVRLSTQPVEEPPEDSDLHAVYRMLNADKTVVYSSDYPHWDGDPADRILHSLPEPMQHRIFWQNAADLYHLTPPQPAQAEDHAPALSRL